MATTARLSSPEEEFYVQELNPVSTEIQNPIFVYNYLYTHWMTVWVDRSTGQIMYSNSAGNNYGKEWQCEMFLARIKRSLDASGIKCAAGLDGIDEMKAETQQDEISCGVYRRESHPPSGGLLAQNHSYRA